ncbi:MAG: hypothetical protein VYD19_03805, partial [Myxococcota bacterium]|nr:hypothetical protein [Myxococcota bacterium]
MSDLRSEAGGTRYHRLGPDEQALVQLLSVIYEPCTAAELEEVYLELYQQRTKKGEAPPLEVSLDALERVGLIEREREFIRLEPHAAQESLFQIAWEGRLNMLLQLVAAHLPHLKLEPLSVEQSITELEWVEFARRLRSALYRDDGDEALALLTQQRRKEAKSRGRILDLFPVPFQSSWLLAMHPKVAVTLLCECLSTALGNQTPCEDILEVAEEFYTTVETPKESRALYVWINLFHFAQGGSKPRHMEPPRGNQEHTQIYQNALSGVRSLCRGEIERAEKSFELVWKRLRSQDEKHLIDYSQGPLCAFHILSIIARRESPTFILNRQLAENLLLEHAKRGPYGENYTLLADCLIEATGERDSSQPVHPATFGKTPFGFGWLFEVLHGLWVHGEDLRRFVEPLKALILRAEEGGYQWVCAESILLHARLQADELSLIQRGEKLHKDLATQSIIELLPVKIGWRTLLRELRDLAGGKSAQGGRQEQRERLIWMLRSAPRMIDTRELESFPFEAYRQRRRKNGNGWERGRPIHPQALYCAMERKEPWLSGADLKVIATIRYEDEAEDPNYAPRSSFSFDTTSALLALVEHPQVFCEREGGGRGRRQRLQVEATKPELRVVYPNPERIAMRFEFEATQIPELEAHETCYLTKFKGDEARLILIECRPVHKQLAELLSFKVQIPRDEEGDFNRTIERLSSVVTIHSALSKAAEYIEVVEGDPTPIVIFKSEEDKELVAVFSCQPSALCEDLLPPGEGGASLITT